MRFNDGWGVEWVTLTKAEKQYYRNTPPGSSYSMTRDVMILGLRSDARWSSWPKRKNCISRNNYSAYTSIHTYMHQYNAHILTARARTDTHARISFLKHISDYKMEGSRWRTRHDNFILIITFTSLKMLKLGLCIGEDSKRQRSCMLLSHSKWWLCTVETGHMLEYMSITRTYPQLSQSNYWCIHSRSALYISRKHLTLRSAR
jgi:hypothetical protein